MATVLDDTQARDDLVKVEESFRYQVVLITQRWLSGGIDPQEWRLLFELEVRYLLTIAGLLGVGGMSAVTSDTQRLIRQQTEAQLSYLDHWMRTVRAPTPRPSDALILARAQLYAGAADETYARARVQGLGIPDLPCYPGERSACGVNCKCYWIIMRGEQTGDWDCIWMKTALESCPQCIRRAQTLAPLRIRGGIIQPFDGQGIYV